MFYRIILFLFFFCIVSVNKSIAQCFASPGNPIAGSSNVGVLPHETFRTIAFYQYSLLDKYYKGTEQIDYNASGAVAFAFYNYVGTSIAYGVSKKFSIESDIGYFINKTQVYKILNNYSNTGKGLSNILISGKYNFINNVFKNIELSAGLGVKIPMSTKEKFDDGVSLPIDLYASTGNYGIVGQVFFVKEFDSFSGRFILHNRYEKNINENLGYKFGDAISTSVYFSKHLANQYTRLTKDITIILQARHEYRLKNYRHNKIVDASGSNNIFIAPQLNYNYKLIWNFSFIFDYPVYQNYNDTQLANTYSISFSITKDFGFGI
jgi:hypothetical protein